MAIRKDGNDPSRRQEEFPEPRRPHGAGGQSAEDSGIIDITEEDLIDEAGDVQVVEPEEVLEVSHAEDAVRVVEPEEVAEVTAGENELQYVEVEEVTDVLQGENDLQVVEPVEVADAGAAEEVLSVEEAEDVLPVEEVDDVVQIHGVEEVLSVEGAEEVSAVDRAEDVEVLGVEEVTEVVDFVEPDQVLDVTAADVVTDDVVELGEAEQVLDVTAQAQGADRPQEVSDSDVLGLALDGLTSGPPTPTPSAGPATPRTMLAGGADPLDVPEPTPPAGAGAGSPYPDLSLDESGTVEGDVVEAYGGEVLDVEKPAHPDDDVALTEATGGEDVDLAATGGHWGGLDDIGSAEPLPPEPAGAADEEAVAEDLAADILAHDSGALWRDEPAAGDHTDEYEPVGTEGEAAGSFGLADEQPPADPAAAHDETGDLLAMEDELKLAAEDGAEDRVGAPPTRGAAAGRAATMLSGTDEPLDLPEGGPAAGDEAGVMETAGGAGEGADVVEITAGDEVLDVEEPAEFDAAAFLAGDAGQELLESTEGAEVEEVLDTTGDEVEEVLDTTGDEVEEIIAAEGEDEVDLVETTEAGGSDMLAEEELLLEGASEVDLDRGTGQPSGIDLIAEALESGTDLGPAEEAGAEEFAHVSDSDSAVDLGAESSASLISFEDEGEEILETDAEEVLETEGVEDFLDTDAEEVLETEDAEEVLETEGVEDLDATTAFSPGDVTAEATAFDGDDVVIDTNVLDEEVEVDTEAVEEFGGLEEFGEGEEVETTAGDEDAAAALLGEDDDLFAAAAEEGAGATDEAFAIGEGEEEVVEEEALATTDEDEVGGVAVATKKKKKKKALDEDEDEEEGEGKGKKKAKKPKYFRRWVGGTLVGLLLACGAAAGIWYQAPELLDQIPRSPNAKGPDRAKLEQDLQAARGSLSQLEQAKQDLEAEKAKVDQALQQQTLQGQQTTAALQQKASDLTAQLKLVAAEKAAQELKVDQVAKALANTGYIPDPAGFDPAKLAPVLKEYADARDHLEQTAKELPARPDEVLKEVKSLKDKKADYEAKLTAVDKALKDAKIDEPDAKGVAELVKARADLEREWNALQDAARNALKQLNGGQPVDPGADLNKTLVETAATSYERTRAPLVNAVGKVLVSANTLAQLGSDWLQTNFDRASLNLQLEYYKKREPLIESPEERLDTWVTLFSDRDAAAPAKAAQARKDAGYVLSGDSKADAPAKAKAVYVEALLARSERDYDAARVKLRQALDMGGASAPWAAAADQALKELTDPRAYYLPQAARLRDARKRAEALEAIANGLEALPGDPQLLVLRSQMWLDAAAPGDKLAPEKVEKTLEAVQAALVDEATKGAGYYIQGRLEELLGRYDEAEASYRKALENHKTPEEADLYRVALARVLLQDRAASPAPPPQPKEPAKLGRADAPAPVRLAGARQALRSALVLAATGAQFDLEPDQDPKEVERVNQAIKLAEELIKSADLKVRGQGYMILGEAITRQGRRTEGLKTYVIGLKLLSQGLDDAKLVEQALKLERLIEEHPAFAEPDFLAQPNPVLAEMHFGKGLHLYWQCRHAEAEEQFQRALAYMKEDARYRYFLGLAQLAQEGRRKQELARFNFEQGARLEVQNLPSAEIVNASLERIQGPLRRHLNQYRQQAAVGFAE